MADDSVTVAVAETDDTGVAPEHEEGKKGGFLGILKGKDEEEEAEHEIEFSTPFGKFELEFEPTSQKARRDAKRREKQEREAAKKAAEAAVQARRKAQEALAKQGKSKKQGGALGKIVLVLAVLAVVGGTIAVAYWLFGRRPEELEAENVPPEYRAAGVEIAPVEPEGFMPKVRERLRRAVRAGRRASAEAQIEQQARYEDLTRRA